MLNFGFLLSHLQIKKYQAKKKKNKGKKEQKRKAQNLCLNTINGLHVLKEVGILVLHPLVVQAHRFLGLGPNDKDQ